MSSTLYYYGQYNMYIQNHVKIPFLERKKVALINTDVFKIFMSDLVNKTEEEINIMLKNAIIKESKGIVDFAMNYLIAPWGISYKGLDEKEKKEIYNLDFSFESFDNFAKNYLIKYEEKCIQLLPKEMKTCFNDKCFVFYCQKFGNPKITKKNFIYNIRDYFILEKNGKKFVGYRNEEEFKKIKQEMEIEYPKLKEKCGINRYLDKFLSYFFDDNDYNIEETKSILNNYYNENNNYIKIKTEED